MSSKSFWIPVQAGWLWSCRCPSPWAGHTAHRSPVEPGQGASSSPAERPLCRWDHGSASLGSLLFQKKLGKRGLRICLPRWTGSSISLPPSAVIEGSADLAMHTQSTADPISPAATLPGHCAGKHNGVTALLLPQGHSCWSLPFLFNIKLLSLLLRKEEILSFSSSYISWVGRDPKGPSKPKQPGLKVKVGKISSLHFSLLVRHWEEHLFPISLLRECQGLQVLCFFIIVCLRGGDRMISRDDKQGR